MAATERRRWLPALLWLPAAAGAGVLPEERADALYHHFDGGGMEISGPSVLVRSNIREKVSVSANWYVDNVSSASIDVLTTASPYTEERVETSVGIDLLQEKSVLGLSWTQSDESDYAARTIGFTASQDFFGDLTTLSIGYARGSDEVRRNGDALFADAVDRHNIRVGLSQVLTRRLVMGLAWEVVAEDGFLNNPYRSVRYLDASSGLGYSYQPENYPRTRTSHAAALRAALHLPWPAAVSAEYRLFSDSWGIEAANAQLAYVHELAPHWRLEGRVRTYGQDAADFYADLFPYRSAQDYLARDKELATFESLGYGFGVGWFTTPSRPRFWSRASLNLQVDFIEFNYDDFRDLRVAGLAPGSEPLYGYDAIVTRLYGVLWY